MSETSWLERMRAGFRKTSDRLGDNLTGLFTKASLDAQTLDEIEEALIASDLGPTTAAKVRERLAGETFEQGLTEAAVRAVVAEELEKILAPVAKPLEIIAFPRPQVILVVGVNGSGKTTTIAKLAHLFQEQDYSRAARRRRHLPRRRDRAAQDLGRPGRRADHLRAGRRRTARRSSMTGSRRRPPKGSTC